MAFVLEHKVADRQNLITDKDVGLNLGRNGKAKARDHAAGIVFDRHIDKIPQLGKVDDAVEMLLHIGTVMAQHRAVQKDIFPRGQVQIKACAQLDKRRDLTVDGD